MKIDKRNPRHWLLLAQQAAYTWIAILLGPLIRKPAKRVITLYGHQLSGNLKALYDEWQKNYTDDFDCYFLSLDPTYSNQLRANGVRVLQCSSLRDMFRAASSFAMITDHGLHMMSPLIRFTSIRFIDVWHGIPFKGFTPSDFRVLHRYDEVWVSSPLLKEIYQTKFGFRSEIVLNMGYARADRLFKRDESSLPVKEALGVRENQKIVLYAPTWQQDDAGRELFPFQQTQQGFIGKLSKVCHDQGAVLVIRSHLNAQISQQHFDNVYYAPMKEFPDSESLLLASDILICDWSSIAFDYLALNRPTIFLDVNPPFKNGFSLGPEYRFGEVAGDMSELENYLSDILTSTDPYFFKNEQKHKQVLDDVYGKSLDGCTARTQLNHLVYFINHAPQYS